MKKVPSKKSKQNINKLMNIPRSSTSLAELTTKPKLTKPTKPTKSTKPTTHKLLQIPSSKKFLEDNPNQKPLPSLPTTIQKPLPSLSLPTNYQQQNIRSSVSFKDLISNENLFEVINNLSNQNEPIQPVYHSLFQNWWVISTSEKKLTSDRKHYQFYLYLSISYRILAFIFYLWNILYAYYNSHKEINELRCYSIFANSLFILFLVSSILTKILINTKNQAPENSLTRLTMHLFNINCGFSFAGAMFYWCGFDERAMTILSFSDHLFALIFMLNIFFVEYVQIFIYDVWSLIIVAIFYGLCLVTWELNSQLKFNHYKPKYVFLYIFGLAVLGFTIFWLGNIGMNLFYDLYFKNKKKEKLKKEKTNKTNGFIEDKIDELRRVRKTDFCSENIKE